MGLAAAALSDLARLLHASQSLHALEESHQRSKWGQRVSLARSTPPGLWAGGQPNAGATDTPPTPAHPCATTGVGGGAAGGGTGDPASAASKGTARRLVWEEEEEAKASHGKDSPTGGPPHAAAHTPAQLRSARAAVQSKQTALCLRLVKVSGARVPHGAGQVHAPAPLPLCRLSSACWWPCMAEGCCLACTPLSWHMQACCPGCWPLCVCGRRCREGCRVCRRSNCTAPAHARWQTEHNLMILIQTSQLPPAGLPPLQGGCS